ncbi:MAG: IS630 family transposase [Blastocatellia bacterium]
MKKDGRTIDHKTLEFIRKMAVERVHQGERPAEVIESYGMNRTVIYKWLKAAGQPGVGLEALDSKNGAGRPKKLTEAQEAQVFRWINGMTPIHHGFQSTLWTRQIIKQLVQENFGTSLCLPTIGALLARLGLIPQNPLDANHQRATEAITRWEQESYPAIVKRARAENSEILFWDEFKFDTKSALRRSGPHAGEATTTRHQNTYAASAMNFQGAFWFATYQGPLTGDLFLSLLKKMMYRRRRPLHLILDGHPIHKRAMVKRYLESNRRGLTLHFLPGKNETAGEEILANQARPFGDLV